MKKEIKHLADLEDCIEYLRVRLAASGDAEKQVIIKNKMYAEIALTKQKEKLCKAGYGASTNSLQTSQHQGSRL